MIEHRRLGRPRTNYQISHLDADERRHLALHRRGVEADTLLRRIISIVLRDNLIDAVLDEGKARRNRHERTGHP
jgi:hypothetical protein